ncbi:TIGR04222 domain-containing membrane protein [Streptomyces sp. NPDC051907]|uniref:TIGR04222 domain-containing membrane protein n=1 Tax=Streptomyces sp. NPDC051907 TaxID=3155284 RepID=UPI00341DB814
MVVIAVCVYAVLGLSSALLVIQVSAAQRAQHGPPGGDRIQDVYEAAFVSGGPSRVVDCALAALQADGRIAVGGPGIVSVHRPVAHDPVEHAVFEQLALAPSGALHTLRLAVMRTPAVQQIGQSLAARGLMTPPGQNRALALWGAAQGVASVLALPPSFILTAFDMVFPDDTTLAEPDFELGENGMEETSDVGPPFLLMVAPALIAGAVIGFTMATRARRRVTRAGTRALRAYAAEYPQAYSPAHAVALYGLPAVADPAFRAQLTAAARVRVARHVSGSTDPYTAAAIVWCASSPGSDCGSSSCGGSSGGGSSCSSSSSGSSCSSSSSGGSSCGSSS